MAYGPQLGLGDVVQITTVCQAEDQISENVLAYKVNGVNGAGNDQLSTAVAAFQALGIAAAYIALMPTTASFNGVVSQRITAPLSVAFPDPVGFGVGTAAGVMMARQVSGFFRKKTYVAGRRKGGRVYVGFVAAGDCTGQGHPTAGYQARLTTLATKLVTTVTWGLTGSMQPVIVTKARPTHVPPIPFATRSWDAIQVLGEFATQRRRGDFGRINVPPV